MTKAELTAELTERGASLLAVAVGVCGGEVGEGAVPVTVASVRVGWLPVGPATSEDVCASCAVGGVAR